MTSSSEPLSTVAPGASPRRAYLEANHEKFLSMASQLFHWPSTVVGFGLSAFGIAAALFAPPPVAFVIALVAYLAVGVWWVVRRHRASVAVYARLRQLLIGSEIPADHPATADLPITYLEPVDAPDLDTLDRLLLLRPEDRKIAVAEQSELRRAVYLVSLGSLVSLACLAAILTHMLLASMNDRPVDGAFLFAMVLGAVPAYIVNGRNLRYMAFGFEVLDLNVERARTVLPALAAARTLASEGPYVSGRVVTWTGNTYVIQMPRALQLSRLVYNRKPRWILIGTVAGATVLIAILVAVVGPLVDMLP